jgi:type IV pilus assembly protein PilA
MGEVPHQRQAGFTLIELMIAVAIIGILASIAIGQYRDYTRRARVSEVVLAATHCKTLITEGYQTMGDAPQPGHWGCESVGLSSPYVAGVQTSSDGAVRVNIANLDPGLNGQYLYLVPMKQDGSTPMKTPADLGSAVFQWVCGSDQLAVRNALPVNCRVDTTPYAAATFQ